jgi:CheY-like chemotaxis protein
LDGSGHGPELLLVDDHDDTRDALAELLGIRGVAVCAVPNPDAALSRLRSSPLPGAVLLDLVMPGIGGLELLRQLKADPQTATIPVVVLTGMLAAEAQAREAGCHAFLAKPIEMPILLATLRSLGVVAGGEAV